MTGRPNDDVLRQCTFSCTVTDLADRHQLPCSVRLSPRPADRPFAQTNPLTRSIVVTRAALAESDSEQAWSAAHEVGHLVDARDRGLLRSVPWRFCGWLLIGGAVAGLGPGMAITALDPVLPAVSALRWGVGLAILVLGFAVLVGCLHPALLCLAAPSATAGGCRRRFRQGPGLPRHPQHRRDAAPAGATARWPPSEPPPTPVPPPPRSLRPHQRPHLASRPASVAQLGSAARSVQHPRAEGGARRG